MCWFLSLVIGLFPRPYRIQRRPNAIATYFLDLPVQSTLLSFGRRDDYRAWRNSFPLPFSEDIYVHINMMQWLVLVLPADLGYGYGRQGEGHSDRRDSQSNALTVDSLERSIGYCHDNK